MNNSIVIKKCKLQPVEHIWTDTKGKEHITTENVLLYFDGYPSAVVHIDAFWQGISGNNKLYDLVCKEGKTIEGEFEFTWEKE